MVYKIQLLQPNIWEYILNGQRPEGEATYSPLATPGYLTIPTGWLILTCSGEMAFEMKDNSQLWKRKTHTHTHTSMSGKPPERQLILVTNFGLNEFSVLDNQQLRNIYCQMISNKF